MHGTQLQNPSPNRSSLNSTQTLPHYWCLAEVLNPIEQLGLECQKYCKNIITMKQYLITNSHAHKFAHGLLICTNVCTIQLYSQQDFLQLQGLFLTPVVFGIPDPQPLMKISPLLIRSKRSMLRCDNRFLCHLPFSESPSLISDSN